jgi:hypothetical protein
VDFSLLGGFIFPSDPFVDAATMSGIVAELEVHLKNTTHFEGNWMSWNQWRVGIIGTVWC